MKPIRVMIVDDHDQVRRGLNLFLTMFDDLTPSGEAKNGIEAIQVCAETRPDVILMDLNMPQMDGITAAREIHERWPHVQIIALTSAREVDLVKSAYEAGMVGYLLKDTSIDAMAETIRGVMFTGGLSTSEAAFDYLQ